jgi:hypothetical protein
MTPPTTFDEICSQVRFQLDDEAGTRPGNQRGVADFVAQVSAEALRVYPTTVPHVHDSVERVIHRLGITVLPEVYIQNEVSTNAYALLTGTVERLVVVINSGLVNLLSARELDFVVAHELGHLGLKHGGSHHDSVMAQSEFAFLRKQSVSRCQEVSADRVGLLGAQSINTAAQVIMKLASGLNTEDLNLDVDAFIQQLDRSPAEMSRKWELQTTHPSLPLRMWALIQFSHSREYNQFSDKGSVGDELSQIEVDVVKRFNALGDGLLNDYEEECHATAVLWSGLMMIMHDNLIERSEQEALADLVGASQAQKAIQFVREHGKESSRKKFNEAIAALSNASTETRQKYIGTVTRFGEIINVNIHDIVEPDQLTKMGSQ